MKKLFESTRDVLVAVIIILCSSILVPIIVTACVAIFMYESNNAENKCVANKCVCNNKRSFKASFKTNYEKHKSSLLRSNEISLRNYIMMVEYVLSENKNLTYNEAKTIVLNAIKYSKEIPLSAKELLTVAAVESNFEKKAKSKTCDYGLYQINKQSYIRYCAIKGVDYNEDSLYSVEFNTKVAVFVIKSNLKYIINKTNNSNKYELKKALIMSYNVGPYAALSSKHKKYKNIYYSRFINKSNSFLSSSLLFYKSFESFL